MDPSGQFTKQQYQKIMTHVAETAEKLANDPNWQLYIFVYDD